MRHLPDYENRGGFSREDFNRIKDEVYRLSRMFAEAPLEIVNTGTQPLLRFVNPDFPAIIVAEMPATASYVPYAWLEVEPNGDGEWLIKSDGRSSSDDGVLNPAYERNNNPNVPVGAVVWLRPGIDGEYIFDYCCTSPLASTFFIDGSSTAVAISGAIAQSTFAASASSAALAIGVDHTFALASSTAVAISATLAQSKGTSSGNSSALALGIGVGVFAGVGTIAASSAALGVGVASTCCGVKSITAGPGLSFTPGSTNGTTGPGQNGTLTAIQFVNTETGSSYVIVNQDQGSLITFTNSSAVTVAISSPAATNFANGWYTDVSNTGQGTVTINVVGGATIAGAPALILPAGYSARIVSDGSNFQVVNLTSVQFNGAQITNSTAQAAPNNTQTLLTWDTNAYVLPASYHSTITNTSRMVIPVTGYYNIVVAVDFPSVGASTGYVQTQLVANGVTVIASQNVGLVNTGQNTSTNLQTQALLQAGDYLQVFVFQSNSGAGSMSLPSNSYSPSWSIRLLAPVPGIATMGTFGRASALGDSTANAIGTFAHTGNFFIAVADSQAHAVSGPLGCHCYAIGSEPTTLHMTITSVSDCSCMVGTYVLTKITSCQWGGFNLTTGCAGTMNALLQANTNTFLLSLGGCNGSNNTNFAFMALPNSMTCSPLDLVWNSLTSSSPCCVGSIKVEITL